MFSLLNISSLINIVKERIETLEELIENSGTQTTTVGGSTVSTSTALHSSSSLDTGGNLINRNILSQQKPYNYHQVQQQQQQHHHQQHQQQPTPFSVSSVKRDSMVAGIVNLGYDHCST